MTEAHTPTDLNPRLTIPTSLDLIGNTPLMKITEVTRYLGISENKAIYAKCEWMNPAGSIKDRAAMSMIHAAEAEGKLYKGKAILDATSGNTGIAFAMIGAKKGYDVVLTLPESTSFERKQILNAYGATLIFTPAALSSDGAIEKARQLYSEDPERYFYADQYSNPNNWKAHYNGTGNEIWNQTDGRVTHFIAAIGTSGTFVGVSRRLKDENPLIKTFGLQPDVAVHGLEGVKHLESALVPSIYDAGLSDGFIEVSTEEAYEMVSLLARKEGVLVGISAAANFLGAVKLARLLDANERAQIVTVFCDGGMKYLSEPFWNHL